MAIKRKLPKCKCCGSEFYPRNNNALQPYCLGKDECIKAFVDYAKVEKTKAENKAFKETKKAVSIIVHPKKYIAEFQRNINQLARKIDEKFNYLYCIDCGKPYGNQIDGGHFHSVGANPTIRYNLHNIHSQKSDCNQNGIGGGQQLGYYRGLVKRYGQEYADLVDTGIGLKYKIIKLTPQQVHQKLVIVRDINRHFDTYLLPGPIEARTIFNNLLGIYL